MAIKIVSGVLGAGKTYYCVAEVLDKYFDWHNRHHEWIQKKDIEIYTNITGLKLPVFNIRPELIKIDSIEFVKRFFAVAKDSNKIWWPYSPEPKSRVLILDEAQKVFGRKFYDQEVFEFFQLSRQLGFDIYLITQDSSTLSKELQNIAEYDLQTVRRKLQLGPFFRYIEVINGEVVGRQIRKKDQRVFMMYTSQQAKEDSKISSYPLKMLMYAVIGIVIMVLSFSWFKSAFHAQVTAAGVSKDKKTQNSHVSKPVVSEIRDMSMLQKLAPVPASLAALPGYVLPDSNISYRVPPGQITPGRVIEDQAYVLEKRDRVGYVAVYSSSDDSKPIREIFVYDKSLHNAQPVKMSVASSSPPVSGPAALANLK